MEPAALPFWRKLERRTAAAGDSPRRAADVRLEGELEAARARVAQLEEALERTLGPHGAAGAEQGGQATASAPAHQPDRAAGCEATGGHGPEAAAQRAEVAAAAASDAAAAATAAVAQAVAVEAGWRLAAERRATAAEASLEEALQQAAWEREMRIQAEQHAAAEADARLETERAAAAALDQMQAVVKAQDAELDQQRAALASLAQERQGNASDRQRAAASAADAAQQLQVQLVLQELQRDSRDTDGADAAAPPDEADGDRDHGDDDHLGDDASHDHGQLVSARDVDHPEQSPVAAIARLDYELEAEPVRALRVRNDTLRRELIRLHALASCLSQLPFPPARHSIEELEELELGSQSVLRVELPQLNAERARRDPWSAVRYLVRAHLCRDCQAGDIEYWCTQVPLGEVCTVRIPAWGLQVSGGVARGRKQAQKLAFQAVLMSYAQWARHEYVVGCATYSRV